MQLPSGIYAADWQLIKIATIVKCLKGIKSLFIFILIILSNI